MRIGWLALALCGAPTVPVGVRRLAELPYGPDPRQRMDVYLPPNPRRAPLLVMVHGGAWDLTHGQVNSALGLPGAYTASVDAFIDRVGVLRR